MSPTYFYSLAVWARSSTCYGWFRAMRVLAGQLPTVSLLPRKPNSADKGWAFSAFLPGGALTRFFFSNAAAVCHETWQTLCFQKLCLSVRFGWNRSEGWQAYIGGLWQKNTNIFINFLSLGKERASGRRNKANGRRWHWDCKSQSPEVTWGAWLPWRKQARCASATETPL